MDRYVDQAGLLVDVAISWNPPPLITNAGRSRSMPPPPWLPDDVMSEILSRTPVKSVCRFRCVSKGWRALISDPALVAAHRCPELLLVVSSWHEGGRKFEIKVMDMDGNVLRVLDGAPTYRSSLAAFHGSLYIDPSSGHVVDLATGHVVVTCPPELRKRVRYLFSVGRTAAPSCTYKAVRVTYRRPHTYMVLTLGEEDAEWRPAPPPPSDASIRYSRSSSVVTLNGVMHFLLCKDNKPPQPKEVDHGVLRFDLESETWKETIKGPPVDITTTTTTGITNLNDALCIVTQLQSSKVHDDDRPRTDLWILSYHGGGGGGGGGGGMIWTKAYSIPMDPCFREFTPLREITRGSVSDGRKQLLGCYDGRHIMAPVLRVYDPLGKTSTEAATKLPGNVLGVLGLCGLHLKHALSGDVIVDV